MTPEVQRIREQSRDFLMAARRCNELRPRFGGNHQLFGPSILLYAFAIEIGFKALALHAVGKKPKGHDLDKLFHALPDQLQAKIVAEVNVFYPGSEPYFDRCLARVARTFEIWGYIHQKHVVDTDLSFLQRLAHVVSLALNAIT